MMRIAVAGGNDTVEDGVRKEQRPHRSGEAEKCGLKRSGEEEDRAR